MVVRFFPNQILHRFLKKYNENVYFGGGIIKKNSFLRLYI